MKRRGKPTSPETIASDDRVKRAIDGLAREIEKPGSYDAADKLTVLIETIEKRASVAIDSKIRETTKAWAWRLGGIGTGFALALAFLGWGATDVLKDRIKRLYPAEDIYHDLRDRAMSDVHMALMDEDYTTSEDLMTIAKEIRKKNAEELIRAFEAPVVVSRVDIDKVAPFRPVEVKVSSLQATHYVQDTACEERPMRNMLQAILLRPARTSKGASFPPWLRCEPGYPELILELSPDRPQSNSGEVQGVAVQLIGVHYRKNVAEGCDGPVRTWQCDYGEIQLTDAAQKRWLEVNGGEKRRGWIRVSDTNAPRR